MVLALSEAQGESRDLAKDAAASSADVRATVERGLAFLARDAVAWKDEHLCSSCHHAAMVVWSMNEAKAHGHEVDESVLADLTQWLTEAGEGKTSVPRPGKVPKALNTKALYYSLGLGSVPHRTVAQRDALKLLLRTVVADQIESGSWAAWLQTRHLSLAILMSP